MVTTAPTSTGIFENVVCGIDGSEQAREAARQARRLRAPEGSLTLVAVVAARADPISPHGAAPIVPAAEEEAERRLAAAAETCDGAARRIVLGPPSKRLVRELEDEGATLVAVGARGHGRVVGLMTGSVTTRLLHAAPCSVLVAREAAPRFPELIVVGDDRSAPAERAVAAARELAQRLGATLRVLVAGDEASAGVLPDDAEIDARPPAVALVEASKDADLVVVGSRGLRGLSALGSVSERVAHAAHCSVLVVR